MGDCVHEAEHRLVNFGSLFLSSPGRSLFVKPDHLLSDRCFKDNSDYFQRENVRIPKNIMDAGRIVKLFDKVVHENTPPISFTF